MDEGRPRTRLRPAARCRRQPDAHATSQVFAVQARTCAPFGRIRRHVDQCPALNGRRNAARAEASFSAFAVPPHKRGHGVACIHDELQRQLGRACYAPEERDDTVTGGQRAVDIERRDSGPIAAHCPRAGIASSASQKAGQLFDTTPGSLTSMPSTTSPRMPKAIPSR